MRVKNHKNNTGGNAWRHSHQCFCFLFSVLYLENDNDDADLSTVTDGTGDRTLS
jgi:hypothetical protein